MQITLEYLNNYVCQTDAEREVFDKHGHAIQAYINDTKSRYYGGGYYLGGQIKCYPNDIISLEKINNVRELYQNAVPPCNSFEAQSVQRSRNMLYSIEQIIMVLSAGSSKN
jgi:hypothetical protein